MIDQDKVDIAFGCIGIGFLIGVILGVPSGVWFGSSNQTDIWKQEIVTRGFARYAVVDTLTGETEFQWKATPTKEQQP